MKNTLLAVIVLVLAGLGIWFFVGKNKAEAPADDMNNNSMGSDNSMDNTPGGDTGNSSGVETTNPDASASVNVTTPPITKGPVKEFTITASNYSFSPSTITVNKGDVVKINFVNKDGFHDFKIDEFGVSSQQMKSPATQVLQFTADKTGTFQYYCSVGSHRAMGMWGTLTVK